MSQSPDIELTIVYRGTDQSPIGQIVDAGFVRNSPGTPTHRVLGSYVLILVLAGRGTFEDAGHRPVPVAEGDLFLLFPNVRHRYGPARSGVWDEFYVQFVGPVFDLWKLSGILNPERPLYRLGSKDPWLGRLTEIFNVAPMGASEQQIVMVSRLQAVLADVVTSNVVAADLQSQKWITEACYWLECDLALEIDIHWVAEKVGFTYDRFRKKFAAETGLTPHQYRSNQRLQAVKKMLGESDLSLKEIAASVGYFDEFALSHQFKHAFGLSPRSYRQSLSKGR